MLANSLDAEPATIGGLVAFSSSLFVPYHPRRSPTMTEDKDLDPEEDNDYDIMYEVDDDEQEAHFNPVVPGVMQSTPEMALMALKITSQPWNQLGHGNDPNVAASTDMAITVERLTSLFLIRIVALISHRNRQSEKPIPGFPNFSDTSTTNICKEALAQRRPWPHPITSSLIHDLRCFVRNMLEKYNSVYYHSFEHSYHVTISCNKLMDMMLMSESSPIDISAAESVRSSGSSSQSSSSRVAFAESVTSSRKTYGLKSDPLMMLALLFSALAHDVEHKGVPNRQLVLESDDLAILYNDQSVAEQRSLAVAFSELMQDEFKELRAVMFGSAEEYRRFRKTVIVLVLATDIASPERTQLVKSKWKEAFGETQESKDRKKIKEMSRRSVFSNQKGQRQRNGSDRTSASLPADFKGRQNSKPRAIYGNANRMKRRGSNNTSQSHVTGVSSASMMSELTIDPSIRMHSHLPTTEERSKGDSLSNIHDDESDEEDSTSATPESDDGLEPVISDEEEFQPPFSGTLSAAPSAPKSVEQALTNGMHDMSTPVIKGGRKVPCHLPEKMAPPPPPPPMARRQTDGGYFTPSPPTNNAKSGTDSWRSAKTEISPPKKTVSLRDSLNRRFSAPDITKNYSVRLSIRRTVDLTGEAIENYSVSSKTIQSAKPKKDGNSTKGGTDDEEIMFDPDDEDELKATVVMEHLLRAADIGPNMQGWEQMEKWSGRLFYELKATHDKGRGDDPETNWFPGQLMFLESYILPLARRLDDMGVFGDTIGGMFARIVQQNKARWHTEGLDVTAQVVQDWQYRQRRKSVD